MWRVLFLLILFISSNAGADVVEDLCQIKNRDLMLAKEQAKRPSLTAAAFDHEYNTDPLKKYVLSVNVRSCVAEHAKADFANGEEIQQYCPDLSTPYSLACFTHWLSKQHIKTPQEIGMWADVANVAREKDAHVPQLNKRVLSVMLLEALVIPTEKYAESKNSKSPTEAEFFEVAKAKVLNGVEERMRAISDASAAGRGPASTEASEAWLKDKIKNLKMRIQKLK